MLPESLSSERLRLQRNCAQRSDVAAEAIMESLEELRPWQDWVTKFEGPASCVAYSSWVAILWGRRFDYQIFRSEDDRFLGQVAIESYRPEEFSAEIGYWQRSSETGHGYMTEACTCLAWVAMRTLPLSRLALLCDERNLKSAAVARRLGMELEAVLRKERLDVSGKPQNTMVWSLIQ